MSSSSSSSPSLHDMVALQSGPYANCTGRLTAILPHGMAEVDLAYGGTRLDAEHRLQIVPRDTLIIVTRPVLVLATGFDFEQSKLTTDRDAADIVCDMMDHPDALRIQAWYPGEEPFFETTRDPVRRNWITRKSPPAIGVALPPPVPAAAAPAATAGWDKVETSVPDAKDVW